MRRISRKKKGVILLSLIAMNFILIGTIFLLKNFSKEEPQQEVIIEEPVEVIDPYQIDVLAVGNSDLYSAFHPLEMWNEYGITSYVCSGAKQNMALSYHMLNEFLKYKTPKVVLLEMDNFFETRGSVEKDELIQEVYYTCGPAYEGTEKWDDIKDQKFHPRAELKGFYYRDDVVKNKHLNYMGNSKQEAKDVPITEDYFPKIMDLLKEKDIPVVFVNFPSESSWTNQKHNTVNQYAKKYDVPYLDFNKDDETGFDWSTDSRDGGNHLNINGAKKMTKYLGKYFSDHYDLKNHRNAEELEQWNKDYQSYKEKYIK